MTRPECSYSRITARVSVSAARPEGPLNRRTMKSTLLIRGVPGGWCGAFVPAQGNNDAHHRTHEEQTVSLKRLEVLQATGFLRIRSEQVPQ